MFKKIVVLGISVGLGLGLSLSLSSVSIARPMPGGNYAETCHNCSVNNGNLGCRCKDRNGNKVWTELNVKNCKTVENDNGSLTCTKSSRHPGHHHHKKGFYDAGPIMSQYDASITCNKFCDNKGKRWKWTGQWRSNDSGGSVCQCKKK